MRMIPRRKRQSLKHGRIIRNGARIQRYQFLSSLASLLLMCHIARAFVPSISRRKVLIRSSSKSQHQTLRIDVFTRQNNVQGLSGSTSPACHNRLFGKGDDDDENDTDFDLTAKQNIGSNEEELQTKIELQQQQIDMLMSMMKQQQQQQQQKPTENNDGPPSALSSEVHAFTKSYVPKQQAAALASVSPLKAMLFIDGTWLYYSIHEREASSCPIVQKYGRGWQRRYYFDWSALPRVICKALQDQDPGWAVQYRPVEIVRASVFTSYKADTSPQSYRFQMYQDMANANYDVHMMETLGKNEKCVDIQIAVEMLHYATVPNAYDVALLLTGDKDFIPAMIRTRQKGRRVGLVSMKRGCNRVLYEAPSDSNDNSEHNHNIRDYDVLWIEDYLDELIKPKNGIHSPDDSSTAMTTSFTLMKVVSDFISKSGLNRVNSRDVGRYLKFLKIGDQNPPRSILDELKCLYGGLYQFFSISDCFTVIARDLEVRDADPSDKSYWIGFRGDADMTLVKAAREAKLSPAEKRFFDEYSLDALDDKESWYRHTIDLAKLEAQFSRSALTSIESRSSPSAFTDVAKSPTLKDDTNDQIDLESRAASSSIPEELTRDYSELTVPKLKDYCRMHGLKVTGTKAQLLERIGEYNQSEIAKIEAQLTVAREAATINGGADHSVNSGDTKPLGKAQSYLVELIAEYVHAAGGQANSRDVGRYLAANKASPTRLALPTSGSRMSALQELKDMYGSLAGFISEHPDRFEKREITADRSHVKDYGFYIALGQPASAPPQTTAKATT